MVAALFGLHPLHVESVAWVAERKDVLSTFFGLLCLIAYARYAQESAVHSPQSKHRNHAWGYYLAALVLFALGLMSKPMLVTLPFVMLLLDCWPLNRARNFIKLPEKIPFFLLATAMSVVTYLVQRQTGMMDSLENVPLSARMGNALISYVRYIGKLFWPTRLAVFYPYPEHGWLLGWVLLAALAMACISALVYKLRVRRPWLLVGWLWFCGTLVPVIGLVQVGGQAMADRYTYLPSLGLFILVVWGLAEAAQPWKHYGVISWVAGCALIIACSGLTREQLGYWQDSETLYQHALAVTENNYLALHNLGIFFFSKGRTDEAIAQYREALRVQPDSAMAHYDLGAALGKKGETDEAIIQFQKALQLNPNNADARINLGTALAMKGRTDKAIAEFAEALRLKPDNAEAHYDLGALFGREGKLDEAIAEFQEAIRLQPDYAAARLNLAHALELKNNR
jgi:tetratricopeptide (TPR) repeat protein